MKDLLRLAIDHEKDKRFADAEACYRQAILAMPEWGDLHNNLGCVLQAQGKIDEAIGSYQKAVALSPNDAVAHHNLGYLLNQNGRIEDAIQLYERALLLNPAYTEAHCNLGSIHLNRGEVEKAETRYMRALEIDPKFAAAYSNLGNAKKTGGKLDEAAQCYQQAITLKPEFADAHNNLGSVLVDLGRFDEAVASFQRAIEIKPDYAEAYSNLGTAFKEMSKPGRALESYQSAIRLKPDNPEAYNHCSNVFQITNRLEEAMVYCNRALALNLAFAPAHLSRGNILLDRGKVEEAAIAYRKALACDPNYAEAFYGLSLVKTFLHGDPDLALLESLPIDSLPPIKQMYAHFALAKVLDDTGNYSRAFEHMAKGNAGKRRTMQYDEPANRDHLRQIAAVFDASLLARNCNFGNPSQTPVFVLGMPRSGSTLVEQILASHPQIQAAGELGTLASIADSTSCPASFANPNPEVLRQLGDAYLRGLPELLPGKLRITDKMPGNFVYVGLIHLILPNATIIHTRRNAIDTCISCYSKLFPRGMPYTYDLAELGRYYRYYSELMDHWRSVLPPGKMLEVSYEELVDDLDGQARRILAHCGLTWDPGCLDFHKNTRPVSTASNVQVRKPLYRSSVERWRRYQDHIQPLLDELANRWV